MPVSALKEALLLLRPLAATEQYEDDEPRLNEVVSHLDTVLESEHTSAPVMVDEKSFVSFVSEAPSRLRVQDGVVAATV